MQSRFKKVHPFLYSHTCAHARTPLRTIPTSWRSRLRRLELPGRHQQFLNIGVKGTLGVMGTRKWPLWQLLQQQTEVRLPPCVRGPLQNSCLGFCGGSGPRTSVLRSLRQVLKGGFLTLHPQGCTTPQGAGRQALREPVSSIQQAEQALAAWGLSAPSVTAYFSKNIFLESKN